LHFGLSMGYSERQKLDTPDRNYSATPVITISNLGNYSSCFLQRACNSAL
jgi:hypothetical protein